MVLDSLVFLYCCFSFKRATENHVFPFAEISITAIAIALNTIAWYGVVYGNSFDPAFDRVS